MQCMGLRERLEVYTSSATWGWVILSCPRWTFLGGGGDFFYHLGCFFFFPGEMFAMQENLSRANIRANKEYVHPG